VNTFVATIDLSLAPKLKNDLEDQGFTLSKPPYTIFSALKSGVSCTLYTSGKLTVQGKGKDDFIAFYLEPEILQSLAYTHPEIGLDLTARIGVDEAGKGDFYGPLCVAGIQADEAMIQKLLTIGVKDSKRMNDKIIFQMAEKIRLAVPFTVVRIFPEKYNEMYGNFKNLNRLLAWGHATAIEELIVKTGCNNVIIDQFAKEPLVESALKRKKIDVKLVQRPRAEEDPVVAAASILARAAFVDGIDKLSKEIGTTLPKGANHMVLEVGRQLVAKHGKEILNRVAKTHFKTYNEITNTA